MVTPSNLFYDVVAKRAEKEKLDQDISVWLAAGNTPQQIEYGRTSKTVEDLLDFDLHTQMTIEAKEALARRTKHGRHHDKTPPVDFRSSAVPRID
jgi:hypothetical protein